MATAPSLKMTAEIAQNIRQHGAETYPHECCGALLGRDGVAGDCVDVESVADRDGSAVDRS